LLKTKSKLVQLW